MVASNHFAGFCAGVRHAAVSWRRRKLAAGCGVDVLPVMLKIHPICSCPFVDPCFDAARGSNVLLCVDTIYDNTAHSRPALAPGLGSWEYSNQESIQGRHGTMANQDQGGAASLGRAKSTTIREPDLLLPVCVQARVVVQELAGMGHCKVCAVKIQAPGLGAKTRKQPFFGRQSAVGAESGG